MHEGVLNGMEVVVRFLLCSPCRVTSAVVPFCLPLCYHPPWCFQDSLRARHISSWITMATGDFSPGWELVWAAEPPSSSSHCPQKNLHLWGLFFIFSFFLFPVLPSFYKEFEPLFDLQPLWLFCILIRLVRALCSAKMADMVQTVMLNFTRHQQKNVFLLILVQYHSFKNMQPKLQMQ